MEKIRRSGTVIKGFKGKTAATIAAIAATVALPQLFHVLGRISGIGSALGETFLPMHLTVLLVAFLAGAAAGGITGLVSPLLSYFLTQMPQAAMLPYMTIELVVYGVTAGLLAERKIPFGVKILLSQIGGRAVKAVAVLIGFWFFHSQIEPSLLWTSIYTGLPGLILQWTILPLLLFYIDSKVKHE